jgi:hypothetical protein
MDVVENGDVDINKSVDAEAADEKEERSTLSPSLIVVGKEWARDFA